MLYRNIIGVVFHDTVTGGAVRELLARYCATIIGGVPGPAGDPEYILRVPDPGPSFEAVNAILSQLNAEPGVKRATFVRYRTPLRLKGS